MSEIVFSHSGKAGDLIYALPAALHIVRQRNIKRTAFNLNLGKRYSRETAQALAALLESQHWIDEVWFDRPEETEVNLDEANRLWPKHPSGDLARRFGLLTRQEGGDIDYTSPWLWGIPADPRSRGRIVLFRSHRYRNPALSYRSLEPCRDRLLFLGVPREHRDFTRECCDCEYLPTRDFLEAAAVIRGAALVVGNQTGLFAVAEALKVPRLLEISPDFPNVIPQGGRNRDLVREEDLAAALAHF